MSYFEDWIEPEIHESELKWKDKNPKIQHKRIYDISPIMIVKVLEEIGVNPDSFESMVLDIMKQVKSGKKITEKQRIVLLRAMLS